MSKKSENKDKLNIQELLKNSGVEDVYRFKQTNW